MGSDSLATKKPNPNAIVASTHTADGGIYDYGVNPNSQVPAGSPAAVSQARQAALDAINAAIAPLLTQQQRTAQQTQARSTDIQGFAKAASELAGNVAPQIQQTYGAEANRQAVFAKGYSDAMGKLQGQSADQINSLLQKTGAPEGQMIQPSTAATDVLYGLGGSIPATLLSNQGGALAAAASFLPATTLQRGAADVAVNASKGAKAQQDIGDQIALMRAKQPELERKIRNDLTDQAFKQHTADLQDKKFGLDTARLSLQQQMDVFNQKYKINSLNLRGQSLKLQADKFARQTLQSDRSYSLALESLGLRKAASKRAAIAQEFKLANGGYTSGQITKYNSLLQQGLDTLPKGTTYAQYVAKSVEHGVPLSLSIARANTHWTDPLQRGTAKSLSDLFGITQAAATGAAGLPSTADYNSMVGKNGLKDTTGVILAAQKFLGVPYKWGGNNPRTGLDCSSFIQQTFKQLGVNLPRTTYAQVKVGKPVDLNSLQPGDAIFTRPGRRGPEHVGLYIGDGQVQESPHTGDVNKIIPLASYLSDGFVAARRFVG